MDETTPAVPESAPPPAVVPEPALPSPAPAPLPQLWRGQPMEARRRRRRRRLWPAVVVLLAVVAAGAFLVTWYRPPPALEFVPAWALGLTSRPLRLPTVPQGDHDRRAFASPGRNALAAASPGRGDAPGDGVDVLATLDAGSADRTRVVYVCARASCDPADPKAVRILADDTYAFNDRRAGWLPLREVLSRLARDTAGPLLLVLDLRPVKVDPRLGLRADDVASGVRAEVAAFPTFPGLILASCGPGEEPLSSEALGRSAFSFYLEEGLRGWADSAGPVGRLDGRVTAGELAAFVRDRVGRWADRARGARQTPTLAAGAADDFVLVVLPRGRRRPHLTLPGRKALPGYPAWLLDGWKTRDLWKKAGADRDAPRVFAGVDAAVRSADGDWRGGGDESKIRAVLAEALRTFRERLAPARTFPRPRPVSLALEESSGREADAAVFGALKALLAGRQPPAADKKPAEVEAETLRAIAGFYAAAPASNAGDYDLARAVFRLASDAREPDRETLTILDRLLRTRQPRPLYAETEALRRIAALPAAAWRPETVRVALDVVRRGELAASRPASLARVKPLIDAAESTRHDGETVLFARGFAPVDEADRLLRRADTALAEAILAGEAVENARRLADEAFDLLPPALEYLDAAPALEGAWFEAARRARAVLDELAVAPPVDPAGARERVVAIEGRAEALGSALAPLRRPFSAEEVARLVAPDAPDTPETYRAISALLDTPFPDAPQRAALWASLLSLDRRLNERVLRLDASDGAGPASAPPARPPKDETPEDLAKARLVRRTRGAAELLALAGVRAEEVDPIRDSPALVARAWLDLPSRLNDATDHGSAERLARSIPVRVPSRRLDDPETNPTRRNRIDEFRALRGWTSRRFAARARDLGGSPFDLAAAEEYRDDDDPPPAEVAVAVDPTPPALDPSRPVAVVPLRFRLNGGPAEARARVDVLTADPDWLEVRRGSPWPSARSPFPAVETSPPSFDLALTSTEDTTVPLEVRLRPEADGATRAPVPLGFLVRSRLGGRSTHAAVRLDVVPASQRLRVVLSTNPSRPTSAAAELRLRPVKDLPPYYLYVENPTDTPRAVLVQLLDGPVIVPGCEAPATVKAGGFTRVSFGAPAAKPETDVYDVRGPLRLRVLDAADPAKVLAESAPPLAVALARDYVRVVEARYEPPGAGNDGKANLRVRLRAVGPIVGPPCPVELVLSPDRVPGLLNAGEGTFRAELAKEGDEALLFAEGLRLDERDDEPGFVDVSVDGVARAFVFRATFARGGEPTTLRLDDRPAVRLIAPRSAFAGAPFEVGLAVDSPPPGGRLELTLGGYSGGAFRVDSRRELADEKDAIRVGPRNPGDAIRFEAAVRDPSVSLDVRRVRGRRELRARLLDSEGETLSEHALPVLFDDRAPAGVKLTDVPRYAMKGAPLELHAVGGWGGAGVQKVVMFAGRPVDGKIPPNAATVEAKPTDFGRTSWAARLPIPDDRKGPLDVSVQFVSAVGLSAFDTATVEVVDAVPVEPGGLQGQVVEGTRPQEGLDLVVLDAKGAEKGRARTDRSGRFAFPGLPPGPYRVVCVKPTPPTRGVADTVVVPGKPVDVTVEMLRTR